MRSNILLSVRMSDELSKRLDTLAKAMDRSRSYVAAEAIEEYLDFHEWQIQGIKAGLKEIEKGRSLDFEEVRLAWEKKK